MPQHLSHQQVNSEEVHEIITAVPSWILKWGITLIFSILAGIILLSTFIKYPDIVKVSLRINSLNAPKAVLARQTGKLTALLVSDGQEVKENEPLAYLESIASPSHILRLNHELKIFQLGLLHHKLKSYLLPEGLNLGELQSSYQNFYQQYLQYRSTLKNGYYLNRITFLEKDLKNIKTQASHIQTQKKLHQLEYQNQEIEYKAYQKLYRNKVISRSEFSQQENKYLASQYPLQQSESTILTNASDSNAKEKELLELRHTIAEEQAKFAQALNQCINDSDTWIMQYILVSPVAGKVSFAGIVQKDQNLQVGQEVFIINPGNADFFGEVQIPQYNMGKIKISSTTLIKLHGYPYEQYGLIRGRINYISDVAYKDSLFIAKASLESFENNNSDRKITLKNGMLADAEIITEESTLFQRLFRNIRKMIDNH